MLGTKWLLKFRYKLRVIACSTIYPSITSGRQDEKFKEKKVRELAHMQPFGTAEDHALAFCCELTKVRGENGGRDDSTGHDWEIDFSKPMSGRNHYA
jgi:hypothetical protein